MITVKIIQASKSYISRQSIYTFELEYPRYIHAQLLTHRVFSKNSSSSRAIPVAKVINNIETNPVEIKWSLNQKGMQGKLIDPSEKLYSQANFIHENILDDVINGVNRLNELNIHKQNMNRYLEPFQNIKVVLTGTEFDNFFWLRCDNAAQHEIDELAESMKTAIRESEPMILKEGEWHLPYVDRLRDDIGDLIYYDDLSSQLTLEEAQRLSTACCAQVSYRVLNKTQEKAEDIWNKLVTSKPPHMSPTEHQATPVPEFDKYDNRHCRWPKGITHIDRDHNIWSGNFKNFIQHRQLLNI